MIVKTDKKTGVEIESWPTLEEAAKAIKLAPKVLRKHIEKKTPPLLNGFIFKEAQDVRFREKTDMPKLAETDELKTEISFAPMPPDAFDGEKLPAYTMDEFGLPVKQELPETAYGNPGISPEIVDPAEFINIPIEDLPQIGLNEKELEELAEYKLTPLQRRLKQARHAKNS